MNLRKRFLMLVAGVTLTPFLSVLLVIGLQVLAVGNLGAFKEHLSIQYWEKVLIPQLLKRGETERIVAGLPEELDVLFIDENGRVQFSTLAGLQTGRTLDNIRFLAEIRQQLPNSSIALVPIKESKTYPRGFLITISPQNDRLNTLLNRNLGFVLPLLLLIVSSASSLVIIRGIDRSILVLEKAARRIASGDLDFELQADGNDEIASVTRSFDIMRKNLKEEYARRARFVMGVSHDLKTPLSAIQGYADAIQDGYADDQEKLQKYVNIILQKT